VGSSSIARALYIAGVRPWHASEKTVDTQAALAESGKEA
jgi:hypothetical protein